MQNFIIDRTFIDETDHKKTRWIIDFKTSEQEVIAQEKQLHNYATIMKQLDPIHPIKLGLYYPLQAKWKELRFRRFAIAK